MNNNDDFVRLAPDGSVSNLPPELYDYVRTEGFKARYGDWEHGGAKTPLDANGEPLVLWHGSPKEFERFDFSHAGDNTGIVEYTDRRTGEKVQSDSAHMFSFTDNRELAISYAFLAKTQEYSRLSSSLSDCMSLMRLSGLGNHNIKSADDFRKFVRCIRRGDDRELIEAFAAVDIDRDHPVSRLDEECREGIRNKLIGIRARYNEYYRANDRGGLSNQLNNYVRQSEYYRYFVDNFDRLCRNDSSVRTEFDTDLTEHNISFFSPEGHFGLSFHLEGSRNVLYGYGNEKVFADTLTPEQKMDVLSRIRSDLNAAISRFNASVRESGYADAVHLYPVFLRIERPLVHDYSGSSFPDKYKLNENYDTAYVAARQVSRAVEQGNDAVVYKNIRDPFLGTTYGVFSADSIEILPAEAYGLSRAVEIPLIGALPGLSEDAPAQSLAGRQADLSVLLDSCEAVVPGTGERLFGCGPYLVTGLALSDDGYHVESLTVENGEGESATFSGEEIYENNRLVINCGECVALFGLDDGSVTWCRRLGESLIEIEERKGRGVNL